jgi:hypothetical protein
MRRSNEEFSCGAVIRELPSFVASVLGTTMSCARSSVLTHDPSETARMKVKPTRRLPDGFELENEFSIILHFYVVWCFSCFEVHEAIRARSIRACEEQRFFSHSCAASGKIESLESKFCSFPLPKRCATLL